jgi:hypothetical protein
MDYDKPAGVLTQTVLRSPFIKRLHTAQVLQAGRNDVILVRASSVEIKTLSRNYKLEDVAFKADFEHLVRASTVSGFPLGKHQDADQHDSDEELSLITDGDTKKYKLPPQMLVLSMQLNNESILHFSFGHYDINDQITFVSYQCSLPTSETPIQQLGEHVASDPL